MKLIVFEGIDGCGKTAHRKAISDVFLSKKLDFVWTREPGGCELSEKLRNIVLNEDMDIKTEALIFLAARSEHCVHIRRLLKERKFVLCERFSMSYLAYQGHDRRLDLEELLYLNNFATGGLIPDLTILFEVDPCLAFSRVQKRQSMDRIESRGNQNSISETFSYIKNQPDILRRLTRKLITIDSNEEILKTERILIERLTQYIESPRN